MKTFHVFSFLIDGKPLYRYVESAEWAPTRHVDLYHNKLDLTDRYQKGLTKLALLREGSCKTLQFERRCPNGGKKKRHC